jgi:riboflavin kinase/FMN adenylyltransferase
MNGLIFGLDSLAEHQGFVITQGTFDGVHGGHDWVLKRVVDLSKHHGVPSMLITFHPHPRLIVHPNDPSVQLLTSIEEKAKKVLAKGIDTVLVLEFTEALAQLDPEEFVKQILVEQLKVKAMVVGYDHRFGKNRKGSFEDLLQFSKKYNFEVDEINARLIDDIAVSSTRIRQALMMGDLATANKMLGSPYTLSGKVIHGNKRGRTIGFPTANLELSEPHKLIPPMGVYAGYAEIEGDDFIAQKFRTMINIGVRPTVDGKNLSIEAHILDFNSDLYGRKIELQLCQFLRNEQKFDGIEALKIQLENDKLNTLQVLI